MYEENYSPLPDGDASVVFAEQLTEMKRQGAAERTAEVTPESVVRWADRGTQPLFAAICRRLLLPGSRIDGLASLRRLAELARNGKACLVCLNHRSTLDVATLYTLMEDSANANLFQQIIWVSGRKLEEDVGLTSMLVRCFNRVVVTPRTWFAAPHSDEELRRARLVNMAAERAIAHLRYQGSVFALFPSGTRIRPGDESTRQAIEETDSYLRMFQYLLLCHIDGCTMPVSRDRDLTHETPRLDRMIYTFGAVHRTDDWRAMAVQRFSALDERIASARAVMEEIESLAPEDEPRGKDPKVSDGR